MTAEWRPTAEELRAVRLAERSLGVWAEWGWADDLRQAALIRLWQTSEKRRSMPGSQRALAIGAACFGMLGEWRRITETWPGTSGKRGPPVEFRHLESTIYRMADEATTEDEAHRAECIRLAERLPGPLLQALCAALQSEKLSDAASMLGLPVATLETRVAAAARCMEDLHAGRPPSWRTGKSRQQRAAPATACAA